MNAKNENRGLSFEDKEMLMHLQWEIDRKTSHIRSLENRLLAALSIDSVIVGILATFYSLNPSIKVYERYLFVIFGVFLLLILGILLYLWWPRKASDRTVNIELQQRGNLMDLNLQLNKIDKSLYLRTRLVYIGLVSFAIQIILLLIIILVRIIN